MGQPGRPQGRSSPAREKQTRGTETSKYPEEEKATAIPLVAASERLGLWDRAMGVRRQAEAAWNGPPETVTAR